MATQALSRFSESRGLSRAFKEFDAVWTGPHQSNNGISAGNPLWLDPVVRLRLVCSGFLLYAAVVFSVHDWKALAPPTPDR